MSNIDEVSIEHKEKRRVCNDNSSYPLNRGSEMGTRFRPRSRIRRLFICVQVCTEIRSMNTSRKESSSFLVIVTCCPWESRTGEV